MLFRSPGDDTGQPVNSGFLRQFDSQTIATCGFLNYDRHEFSFFNSTLPHLMDGATSTLNNAPAFGNPFGPGDVTWALQWDFVGLSPPRPSIPAGGTATITKEIDLRPVPEPVGAVTAGILLVALIRGRRHVG